MNMLTIDGKQLKENCDTSSTAHAMLQEFAGRERFRRFIDMERTKMLTKAKGIKLDDKDYLKFFKSLQDSKCGAIIHGRNGKRTRFEWYYNLVSVGKAALNGTTEKSEDIKVVSVERRNAKRKKRSDVNPIKVIRRVKKIRVVQPTLIDNGISFLFIPLRANLNVELNLPKNLTVGEVGTIKMALDRLVK